jgi:hypothetical protein
MAAITENKSNQIAIVKTSQPCIVMWIDLVSALLASPAVTSADTSSMSSSSGGETAIALALGSLSLIHPRVILQAALPTSHLASSVAKGDAMAAIMGEIESNYCCYNLQGHSHV